jgi:hypothetical protein
VDTDHAMSTPVLSRLIVTRSFLPFTPKATNPESAIWVPGALNACSLSAPEVSTFRVHTWALPVVRMKINDEVVETPPEGTNSRKLTWVRPVVV